MLSAILVALGMSSCAMPGVRELARPVTESKVARLLVSTRLPPELRNHLKAQGVSEIYRRSPGEAIRRMSADLADNPSEPAREKLARICLRTGEMIRDRDPVEAAGHYLDAAWLAFDDALATADTPGEPPLRIVYNHSCRSVARLLFDAGKLSDGSIRIDGPVHDFEIRVKSGAAGMIDPAFVDTVVPADFLKFKRLEELTRIRHEGLGGRLVGHRVGSAERREDEPLLHPDTGLAIPMTATLDFAGRETPRIVTLSFHDTLHRQEGVIRGKIRPLATDLTAPLAILYNFAEPGNIGFKNMTNPLRSRARTGLLQLEPFHPDEIPVIFVHGLKSSPQIWMEPLNRLRADPVLRDRFQFMCFEYPSGFPLVFNAASLRRSLAEFREHYDPRRELPAMRKVILVGHSMGGILSNFQIRDSGEILRERIFDRPIQETGLSMNQRQKLEPAIYFQANPDVRRVIFVASPHRGSRLATGLIGGLGTRLIRLPFQALLAARFDTVEGLTPAGKRAIRSRLNSVHNLQPGGLALTAVWELPNTHGVPMHSIIAHKKPSTLLKEGTDGVVPYSSSHILQAASEVVVSGEDHNSIVRSETAIVELRRILYEHIGKKVSPD